MYKLTSGFTLIELLIAIAIIGILYAVALPGYSSYVQDGRRADVQRIMLQEVAILERQYTRLGGYPDTSGLSDTEYYTFTYEVSLAAAATPGILNDSLIFKLTAVPKVGSAQASDDCLHLSIDHLGAKDTTSALTNCWQS